MPKRFTDSEKWKDPWFHKLLPISKLFFLYMCDQCDIAGFWEIDLERAVFDTGHPRRSLEGALKDLERCYETNGTYVWIKRFIKFQNGLPLSEASLIGSKKANKAHLGIVRLLRERETFSENITLLLDGKDLPSSYEGVNKGLFSPPSKGKGKGKGKGKEEDSKNQEADNSTDQIIDYLNEKTNSSFKHSKASRENISARLNGDGLSVDDCKLLIDYKVAEWLDDPKTAGWLNPETLFRPTKWEKNLSAARRWASQGRLSLDGKKKSLQAARGRSFDEYKDILGG